MKKALIGIFFIVIAILMIYLTRPSHNQPDAAAQAVTTPTDQPVISINSATAQIPLVDPKKCDTDAMLKALDALKEERDKALKALSGEVMSAEQLSRVVRRDLKDHLLANQINPHQPTEQTEKSPEQKALREFQQNREQSEELFMGALAGQSNQYIDKFKAGQLAPLDPNSALHKVYMVNVASMAGGSEVLNAIERLYPEQGVLEPALASAIIQGINDPKALKRMLSRLADINQVGKQTSSFFGSGGDHTPIQIAIMNSKYDAAEILLELGAKPSKDPKKSALNYFYKLDEKSVPLVRKMLNHGFRPTNSSAANNLARNLKEFDSALSSRVSTISEHLKAQEKTEISNLPLEYRQIVDSYNTAHEPLNKEYLQCLVQENNAKPKIPAYQPIDTKQIERQIDQLIAQKVEHSQIIVTLANQNKETVEHGYKYLDRLRMQQNANFNLNNMPNELRSLIGYLKDEKWQEMIDLMKGQSIDPAWQVTPGTMLGAMIEKNAPESALMAMAKLSDKNDVALLNQAIHDPELLKRIANYGFNLDVADNSNKNLFYQAVRTNSTEQLDYLIAQGVSMASDPYGYDPLDFLLRKKSPNLEILGKLQQVGFPLTEHHLDYSRYLKTHHPKRYEKLMTAWPNLQVEGEWQAKSQ